MWMLINLSFKKLLCTDLLNMSLGLQIDDDHVRNTSYIKMNLI